MGDRLWAAAWLALYSFMFLLSGHTLVTLCYKARKTHSIRYYSLLIAAMSIMTFEYSILVVGQAIYIS
jgi:hypothetical protein